MRIKAKLPERQSKGVIGPSMTEDDYLRHTAKQNGQLEAISEYSID